MFDIEAEGLSLNEKIDSVVHKLEDKYCTGPNNSAYLFGRLLGCYAMMKRIYHGFDRRMKVAPILNRAKQCPRQWFASQEPKKAQIYIDRANARALTNYRCFEHQFKSMFSKLGGWNPLRVTSYEQSLINLGWFHQSLFNDKMDDYIRLRNKSKYGKEEGLQFEAEVTAAESAATAAE